MHSCVSYHTDVQVLSAAAHIAAHLSLAYRWGASRQGARYCSGRTFPVPLPDRSPHPHALTAKMGSLLVGMEFQHILRLLNTNVDGKEKIMYALTSIKGIGRRFANICCKKAEVDMKKRAGESCMQYRGSR